MSAHRRSASALVAALVLCSAPAQASDTSEACTQAHLSAQRLRKQGKLRAARDELLSCMRPECPALAREDCGPWLAEVERELPTVVVVAMDAAGTEIGTVRVLVDGEPRVERLDGRPVELDPGEHVVRYETHDADAIEQRIFINVGENNRVLRVQFRAPTAPVRERARDWSSPGAAPPPPPPIAAVASLGLGVVALGTFGTFALVGRARENDLAASCSPFCTTSDRGAMLRDYRIADVSLGVAVVALGVGAWLFFHPPRGQ